MLMWVNVHQRFVTTGGSREAVVTAKCLNKHQISGSQTMVSFFFFFQLITVTINHDRVINAQQLGDRSDSLWFNGLTAHISAGEL